MDDSNFHDRLSPSGSSRWLACPFSLRAPASPSSEASREGEEAHEWAGGCLTGERSITNCPKKFVAGVGMYISHVMENGVEPVVEERWSSLDIPGFSGRIDALLYSKRHLVVYDFKFGKWPVEAENNTQLLCYSAIGAEHFQVDTFHGVIVQPRAKSGPKIKVAEYTPKQVAKHRERVIEASTSEEKHTGDHCRFCTLRTTGQCEEGIIFGEIAGWR